MSKYLLDSFAIIEYLDGSILGKKVQDIIEKEDSEVLISSISISEVLSKVLRQRKNPEQTYKILVSMGRIINLDLAIAELAAKIHAKVRVKIKDFGLADAIILASAKINDAKLITGDKHFKGMRDIIYLE